MVAVFVEDITACVAPFPVPFFLASLPTRFRSTHFYPLTYEEKDDDVRIERHKEQLKSLLTWSYKAACLHGGAIYNHCDVLKQQNAGDNRAARPER